MKKMHLVILILGMLVLASAAFGGEIAEIAWDQSNIETLRSFDSEAIARFLNSGLVEQPVLARADEDSVTAGDIQEFTWANLSGDNQYQLVIVFPSLGSRAVNSLSIYSRDPSEKITEHEIKGTAIRLEGSPNHPYIPKVIEDLDGNGKEELIIPTQMGFGMYGAAPVAVWPKVYRLQNGKLIDASHDYAKFYDAEVLPDLNREIEHARKGAALEDTTRGLVSREYKMTLDTLIMARDKILRVIGRDPQAGEQQARAWVMGPDPDPSDAAIVFHDMGDHEEDLRAAHDLLKREAEETLKATGGVK